MSIDSSTLTTVRKAGEAVYAAHHALTQLTQGQADRVVQAISANPFGLENDELLGSWKAMTRLAQELQTMEQQLRFIYETAAHLGTDDGHARAAAPRKSAVARRAKTRPAAKRAKRVRTEGAAGEVKGNNAKVLNFLGTVLGREEFTPITQARIAEGANVPKGSISLALSQLGERGLIVGGPDGGWRLA